MVRAPWDGTVPLRISPIYITWVFLGSQSSGDSWMYPYQRTPMGNPYISPISRGYLWVIPKNPKVEHNKYHGSTLVGVRPSLSLEIPFKGLLEVQPTHLSLVGASAGEGFPKYRGTTASLCHLAVWAAKPYLDVPWKLGSRVIGPVGYIPKIPHV